MPDSGLVGVSISDPENLTQLHETRLAVSCSSTTVGSASADSTNCRWKILGKVTLVQNLFLPFSKQCRMTMSTQQSAIFGVISQRPLKV